MQRLVMMLKTYSCDFEYVERLLDSFHRFNIEAIHLYIVAPQTDMHLFEAFQTTNVSVLEEELFASHLVRESIAGIRPGYINQEIIKLAFWELGLADNYVCLDSDLQFLRPFRVSDFMASDTVPFTFVTEDRELLTDSVYYNTYGRARERSLRKILEHLDMVDAPLLTCHNHQVFSAAVLSSFKEKFLDPRGWRYDTALGVSPYEFSWYTFWLQKSSIIPFVPREPIIKMIHSREQFLNLTFAGTSEFDIARGYVGLVVNSNFSREVGPLSVRHRKEQVIAFTLSSRDLVLVVKEVLRLKFQRLARKTRRIVGPNVFGS